MTGPRPLRVGVISANWGMLAHLPAWQAIEGVSVEAVCTSREETARAASARFGIPKAYWSHEAMAADPDLDIIDVGTRPDLRHDMVLAALAHGKHVYASAAFAADIKAARDMRDAARAARRVVALDTTLSQAPAHRQAKALIRNGFLGEAQSVTTRLGISLFTGDAAMGSKWRWFAQAKHGASAMRNLGTHSLHLLVDLLGPIDTVAAQARIALPEWRFPDGSTLRPEVPDTAHLLLHFESGVIGTVALGWSSPALLGWRMELSGTRGTIVTEANGAWFPAGPAVKLMTGADGAALMECDVPQSLIDRPDLHFDESAVFPPQSLDIAGVMLGFVTAIRENGQATPDFERAVHIEAVLEAARRAATEGRQVSVAEVEDD